mmetsp:Transcript_39413/g.126363  ORF Transcript_39413/g.126363 Transcript_39413/m.126363 type:complete len:177 (-) Transcript_39413:57-587(-)
MFFSTCCGGSNEDLLEMTDLDMEERVAVPTRTEDTGMPVLLMSRAAVKVTAEKGTKEGGPCMLIDEETGECMAAEFIVDALRRHFVLQVFSEGARQEMSCPIEDIQDIFQIEDGDDCFPAPVLKVLGPEQRPGLFMLVSGGFLVAGRPVGVEVSLSVTVATQELRIELLEYMRMLV